MLPEKGLPDTREEAADGIEESEPVEEEAAV